MARIYAALAIVGLIVLFLFIVAGMVTTQSLFWRTGAPTYTLTIVEHCFYLVLILTYLLIAISIMFAAPDFRHHKYAFLHGTLIGFSYPFAIFMVGESSAWWMVPSATIAGLSDLSAIMGGFIFGGIFTYWTLLSRPSTDKTTVSMRGFSRGFQIFELTMTLIWMLFILITVTGMAWLVVKVQSQQGFTFIANAVAYVSVLLYAYLVRLHYLKTRLAMGALFGAALAVVFMSAKWTFNFASRYSITPSGQWATLYIVTSLFSAALSVSTVPLLVAWGLMEAKSRPGRGPGLGAEAAA